MAYEAKDYVLPAGLQYALEGAIALNRPLLLTGEPGTGKTTLADWAAWHLHQVYAAKGIDFAPKPLRFSTKTNSQARDLFYVYDALSHFQAANLRREEALSVSDFIELRALGKAIVMSNPTPQLAGLTRDELPEKPRGSVVLIDEIDKAPRDFTNDILDEIDQQRFRIMEHNQTVERGAAEIPIVTIMTSNSEKNLPDAFLRRCAFFHIEFPKPGSPVLRKILQTHLGEPTGAAKKAYDELVGFFFQAREASVRKKPATAELLGWLKLLELNGYFEEKDAAKRREQLEYNLSFLVKTREDLEAVRKLL
ncbi:AAA family ATPase [Lewinellaceae bacterium SD302]|nr:AAA family ATPase [Lewinellaceae bacterium SD302]